MLWVQRVFGQIFSLLFLSGLLLTALSFSVYQAFNKPDNLQKWLSESQLYDHFTDGIVHQSLSTFGVEDSAVDNSAAFQQAAKQAFTPELIKQSVNTVIDSTYDWLNGTTPAPNFSIDLSNAKATFARQAALNAQQRLSALPACTPQQVAQLTPTTDPLSVICLPPGTSPAQLAQQIEQRLLNSQEFLSNPIITADNLNPVGGEPYYKAFPDAPRYYQFSQYATVVFAVISVVLGIVVFSLSQTRRKGVRRVGILFGVAGIILVAGKLVADFVIENVRTRAFNNTNVGELQTSLTDFLSRVEGAVQQTTLWFGVAYIGISALMIVGLLLHRKRTPHHHKTILDDEPSSDMSLLDETPGTDAGEADQQNSREVTGQPFIADNTSPTAQPLGPPPLRSGVKPRKKPRLIQ